MSYDIFEHQHRFAIWTAARAVQRSFTKTINIETAINSTSLRSFSETEMNITSEEYHYKHQEWTNILIKNLSKHHECSYGRAAKIIAVYLKTSVIIPEKGMTQRCDVIYPPIDRVILQSIAHHEELKDFSKKVWTQFDEGRYHEVADRIRNKFSYFNWRIEEYWNLKDE